MKFMNVLLAVLFTQCAFSTAACERPNGKAFDSLSVGDGAIVFDFVPVDDNSGIARSGDQLGINVYHVKCSDGTKSLVGDLPYLAATGLVRAAFLADTGSGSELFVIHSVDIRSDAGMRYSSDYYSVHVYRPTASGYTKDERLSRYFGDGADVLNEDYKRELYTFPYKNQLSILAKLNSDAYRRWRSGSSVKLVINTKAFLHEAPTLADKTRMYLVAGDQVQQIGVEAGWLSVSYRTVKGKVIDGWIQCSDADGC
ncbi:hypothetical protein V2J82_05285 [Pseudomonas alliivorans]|nr:hypothetical protein [Pseudomonas alliivorans]